MYYSHPCSVCNKIFYTFNDDRYYAADALAAAIKQHLIDYNEDDHETQFDYGEKFNAEYVNQRMTASDAPPSGGYQV